MLLNRFGLGLLCISTIWIFASPVKAETCRALNVVGGQGTEVTKIISPPGTVVTSNNWNTDFSVPGGRVYNRYYATITVKNEASYDVKLDLKYSNNTASEFYNKSNIPLKVGQQLKITGEPRSQFEPYQINVFVGGLNAIGNSYTVSVAACD